MNTNQARYLHRMLDRLVEGERVEPHEVEALRKSLPEMPKQKTLEEIAWDMHFAWCETYGNDWEDELFGDLETWLSEQHTQLRAHLEGVKREAHPEFLETEEDYENAPDGTIVAADKVGTAWIKTSEAWHSTDGDRSVECPILSVGTRRVLRWGWGE